MEELKLSFEQLEERIAPGMVCGCDCDTSNQHGNNGWGNGEDSAPGNSLEHQPKFEDPNTGASPSNSPASADGDR
jgi:hypothetical protein